MIKVGISNEQYQYFAKEKLLDESMSRKNCLDNA
jgi:hypothetical protein